MRHKDKPQALGNHSAGQILDNQASHPTVQSLRRTPLKRLLRIVWAMLIAVPMYLAIVMTIVGDNKENRRAVDRPSLMGKVLLVALRMFGRLVGGKKK